jgi:hypothetical protein
MFNFLEPKIFSKAKLVTLNTITVFCLMLKKNNKNYKN